MIVKWCHSEGSSKSKNEDGQVHLSVMVNDDKDDDLELNSMEVLDYL